MKGNGESSEEMGIRFRGHNVYENMNYGYY